MDVVNVDYAGAIMYQSTVKPISCTINPRSTDFSRVKHEKHHQWSVYRLMNWAKDIGDEFLLWVKAQLNQRPS